jgi:hypothetical protein
MPSRASRARALPALVALALTVGSALPAVGQGVDAAPPGTRVRVMARGITARPLVGVVNEWRPDALVIRSIDRPGTMRIPLPALTRLDVSQGRHSHWVRGGAIGLAAGLAASGLFLAAFCSDLDTSCHADTVGRVLAIFGLPPTMIGLGIGLAIRSERWERVPLPGSQASGPGDGQRVAAGLRIPF